MNNDSYFDIYNYYKDILKSKLDIININKLIIVKDKDNNKNSSFMSNCTI